MWDACLSESATLTCLRFSPRADNSGFIDIEEFGRALEIDHAAEFVAKLYQLFDQDDSGEIDFREFVIGCSQFTSADSDAKLRFAFWLYDFNADGTISKEEMAKLLEGFNLASAKQIPAKVDMIFQKVDRNRDGVISFDEFRSFSSAFPSMVFPAYSLWYRTNGMAGTK